MTADTPCVLVTGAGRGLGRAIAETFHTRGYLVVATDYDASLLADLEGAPGYLTARHDVSDPEDAATVAAMIRERCGRLDVVVNNAGVNPFYPVCETPPQRTIQDFTVNAFGPLIVTQACLDLLLESGGRVVNICSESSTFRAPFQIYQSSKMALECLSDVMRRELQLLGGHVAIIRPGAIRTNLMEEAKRVEIDVENSRFESFFPKLRALVARSVPKKVSEPEEVAAVVYRAATDPKKRAVYAINNDPRQKLAALLPKGIADRLIHRLLLRG